MCVIHKMHQSSFSDNQVGLRRANSTWHRRLQHW